MRFMNVDYRYTLRPYLNCTHYWGFSKLLYLEQTAVVYSFQVSFLHDFAKYLLALHGLYSAYCSVGEIRRPSGQANEILSCKILHMPTHDQSCSICCSVWSHLLFAPMRRTTVLRRLTSAAAAYWPERSSVPSTVHFTFSVRCLKLHK